MPCSPARSALWGIFFFPPNTPRGPPAAKAHAHIVRLGPHWLELELQCWEWGVCLLRPGSTAFPIQMQTSFGFLKRRISPGCILLQPPHTGPCQPKAGVWLPLIVWLLKPSVWAAPECLHCPDLLPEPRRLCSGPGALSLGIRVIT